MPRLEILVDGEKQFDGDVPQALLPSRPELFPKALGQDTPQGTPPPPLAKLTALTGLVEVMRRAFTHPMLGAHVQVTTRDMGCLTIDIDLPLALEAP